jgi:hypothetical protein
MPAIGLWKPAHGGAPLSTGRPELSNDPALASGSMPESSLLFAAPQVLHL